MSMKTRKRDRSPDPDCEDCLPISKRITRLNIQSTSRTSVDEQETNSSHCLIPGVSSPLCNEQAGGVSWQNGSQRSEFTTGNNNNINCLPCGSTQCDSSQNLVSKNSISAYAVHHGIPKDDLTGYTPELNQSDNPHYFHMNRVLYQAHLEKAQRQGSFLKNPF